MTCESALSFFLQKHVEKNTRKRYLALLETKKGKLKFLRELDHHFASHLIHVGKVFELPLSIWNSPCYLFSSREIFGQEWSSLDQAYKNASLEGGWLFLEKSGKGGIFRP